MRTADEVLTIALKQFDTSELFRQPRLKEILENENMLAGATEPALVGRYNFPFDAVVANGFVDTLVAQVNKPPRLEFYDDKGSNLKSSKKITAMWEKDSSRGKWSKKDRLSKRLCAVSNIGIFKYSAVSDPKYKSIFQIVDHYDFHCEPNGGGDLEDHVFAGQTNIFKNKEELKSTKYDQKQVNELTESYSATDFKKTEDQYRNKINRMAAQGLDTETNNYVGSELFNLTEWITEIDGHRYYILFDKCKKVWVRFAELKEVYESELYPWVIWQARENSFNIWARGPFDDIKPIAKAIKENLNEILNNNRKRNWDMKAVDSQMFPDLSQLDYRPDGVAFANVPAGKAIQSGVYHFQTPEISGAINLNNYLNNFMGEKSGISAQTEGTSGEDKVGIYEGNAVQVSKRMKLIGDSYDECYADVGLRYDWGLWEHCSEDEMVKIIGINGAEWESIKKEDTEPDYVVRVISRVDEQNEQTLDKRVKISTMNAVEANPILFGQVNPATWLRLKLDLTGFDSDLISSLTDTKSNGNDLVISEAKKGIELILKGKEAKLNRNATNAFLETVHNFMTDNDEISEEVRAQLQAYFDLHVPVVAENEMRSQQKAQIEAMGQVPPELGRPNNPPAPTEMVPEQGVANTI